jgi:hypothetical protein
MGEKIMEGDINQNTQELEIKKLSPGIYFIKASNSNVCKFTKL